MTDFSWYRPYNLAFFPPPEAATGGVLCKKMFLEISQNSQENTCARDTFNLKRVSCTDVFGNSQEHLFYRTPQLDCFWRPLHSLPFFQGNSKFKTEKKISRIIDFALLFNLFVNLNFVMYFFLFFIICVKYMTQFWA